MTNYVQNKDIHWRTAKPLDPIIVTTEALHHGAAMEALGTRATPMEATLEGQKHLDLNNNAYHKEILMFTT